MLGLIPWLLGGFGLGLLSFKKEGAYTSGPDTLISKASADVAEMTSDSIEYFFRNIDGKVYIGLFLLWYLSDLKGKQVRPAVTKKYKKYKSRFGTIKRKYYAKRK